MRVSTGDGVEFRVLESDRGLKACDVRLLHGSYPAAAPRNDVAPAGQAPIQTALENDDLIEVFTEREFIRQMTDLLLTTAPQLTGGVIIELRASLLQFARKNGWIE
jgi:hypothetical protein